MYRIKPEENVEYFHFERKFGDRWRIAEGARTTRKKVVPVALPLDLATADWFGHDKVVMVVRTWYEYKYRGKTQMIKMNEISYGRVVGISQRGKVWVMVYNEDRKRSEIRLVSPVEIHNPGTDHPTVPKIPDYVRLNGSMSVDTSRVA